ncbi:SoxR reducing system RseC family protein [bacterium]|nr:SoxR reducing system RseC family protein [bacterium]
MSVVFGKVPVENEETAVVVEVDGDSARVHMNVMEGCSSCGSSGFCHPQEGGRPLISIDNRIGAKMGDVIVLETNPGTRVSASLIVFGLPLLMTLLGVFVGAMMPNSGQDGMVAGSIAGLAFGMLLVRWINRIVKNQIRFKPRATRIVNSFS